MTVLALFYRAALCGIEILIGYYKLELFSSNSGAPVVGLKANCYWSPHVFSDHICYSFSKYRELDVFVHRRTLLIKCKFADWNITGQTVSILVMFACGNLIYSSVYVLPAVWANVCRENGNWIYQQWTRRWQWIEFVNTQTFLAEYMPETPR